MIARLERPPARSGNAHLTWRRSPGLDGGVRGGALPRPPADLIRDKLAEQRHGPQRRPRSPRPGFYSGRAPLSDERVDEGIRAIVARQRANDSDRVLIAPRAVVEQLAEQLAASPRRT